MSEWVYVGIIVAAILLPLFVAAMENSDEDDIPTSSLDL